MQKRATNFKNQKQYDDEGEKTQMELAQKKNLRQ